VANLWDVTDRDVDRFSKAVLQDWLEPQGAQGKEHGTCVSRAVGRSRNACRLKHLIGAAPVCYGVPTAVLAGRSEEGC
jgi:separase